MIDADNNDVLSRALVRIDYSDQIASLRERVATLETKVAHTENARQQGIELRTAIIVAIVSAIVTATATQIFG